MDRFLAAIDTALKKKKISDAAASKLAVGHPAFLKNLRNRRGGERVHPIEALDRLADVLGLELYLGPPRPKADGPTNLNIPLSREKLAEASGLVDFSDQTAPLNGYARCSVNGWYDDEVDRDPVVRPSWVSDPDAFWVNALGQSMVPEGIQAGDFCIISPGRAARVGDRVFLKEAGTGKTSIKRLIEMTTGTMTLQGWMPPRDGVQREFIEERPTRAVTLLYPVLAVYRGTPGKAGVDVRYIPDPRAGRHDDLEVIETLSEGLEGECEHLAPTSIGLPGAWVRRHTKGRGRIVSVSMSDDSMAPSIPKGALVLGTSNDIAIQPKALYIIRLNGEVLVRRLEQFPDGAVLVSGDNASARTTFLPAGQRAALQVLASVFWIGRQFG